MKSFIYELVLAKAAKKFISRVIAVAHRHGVFCDEDVTPGIEKQLEEEQVAEKNCFVEHKVSTASLFAYWLFL